MVAPGLSEKDRNALRVCTRCYTVAKPRVAMRAWQLWAMWLLGVIFAIAIAMLSSRSGVTAQAEEHWVTTLLFFGALLYPRVCNRCQSATLIPLDSPRAAGMQSGE